MIPSYLSNYAVIYSADTLDAVFASGLLLKVFRDSLKPSTVFVLRGEVVPYASLSDAIVIGLPPSLNYRVTSKCVLLDVRGDLRGAYYLHPDRSVEPIEEVDPRPPSLVRLVYVLTNPNVSSVMLQLIDVIDEISLGRSPAEGLASKLIKAFRYGREYSSFIYGIIDDISRGDVDSALDTIESYAARYDIGRDRYVLEILGRALRSGSKVIAFYDVGSPERIYVDEAVSELSKEYSVILLIGSAGDRAEVVRVYCRDDVDCVRAREEAISKLRGYGARVTEQISGAVIEFAGEKPKLTELIRKLRS